MSAVPTGIPMAHVIHALEILGLEPKEAMTLTLEASPRGIELKRWCPLNGVIEYYRIHMGHDATKPMHPYGNTPYWAEQP